MAYLLIDMPLIFKLAVSLKEIRIRDYYSYW